MEYHFMDNLIKRKMKYAWHVLRGSGGLSYLQILEGRVEGINKVDAPRRTWMIDVCEWTGPGKYYKVKREAEERESWRRLVAKFRYKVEKWINDIRRVTKATEMWEREI
jgi:hypothetical protein